MFFRWKKKTNKAKLEILKFLRKSSAIKKTTNSYNFYEKCKK